MRYLVEYWLHNQSRLFSEPQRVIVEKTEVDQMVEKIKNLGYEINEVREV